jgi:hypothetical protein
MAEEERIFGLWIAMQVDHLDVGAVVKNLLRAVAVVIVNVEHRHALCALIAEPLRGAGGIVDEAIAAGKIAAGMVAGRTAERKGGALAAIDQSGGGDRHVMR